MTEQAPPSRDPIYFFGCDMGGWQNTDEKKGDALAVCRWNGAESEPGHMVATAAVLFFPVADDGVLATQLRRAQEESARVVVAIDAALGWPTEFTHLVANARKGVEYDLRQFSSAINNPYLYRETERFIKLHVRKDKDPLTAPGDKFGNNSSKAQMLVAWLRQHLPNAYRPPFDDWNLDTAKTSRHSIIEVYPDASVRSKQFKGLKWPAAEELVENFANKDIADAKVCALTGVCYAMQVGLIPHRPGYPGVYLPDDPLTSSITSTVLSEEGWIFTPYDSKKKQG